jgi:Tfp pilus assembly protein PilV
MNKFKNQLGITLVEVLIAIVLLSFAIQGAMSLMTFTAKQKLQSEHRATMKLVALNFKKVMDRGLNGLVESNFEEDIFYSYDQTESKFTPDQTLLEPNEQKDVDEILASTNPSKNSSFSFYPKLKKYADENTVKTELISYCVKIGNDKKEFSRDELREVSYRPFVSFSSNGALKIQCCQKSKPNCQDEEGNILDPLKSKFIVKTMVFSHKKGGETVINAKNLIKEGERKHVNGIGFFIYKPNNVANQIRAVSYLYWSDCIDRSLKNLPLEGCKPRVYRELNKFQKNFDQSLGSGVNELGDLNI